MTSRPTIQIPVNADQAPDVPTYRFWGTRKPPKNRADIFSFSKAARAAEGDTRPGAPTPVQGTVATIRIYGPIDSWGGYWGVSARDVSEALDQLGDVDEVRVRINSPGGEAWEGMAIANMFRAHPANIVGVVDGVAASAASAIAVGCDETVMSPGTQMMIHDASTFAYGPAAIMRKAATFLDSTSNAYAELYTDAAGSTVEAWRGLMVETTWYTAQEAVAAGLAARVAVVPDAGSSDTAGTEDEPVLPGEGDEIDESVEDAFDLSMYPTAGRSKALAPKPPNASAVGSTTTQERKSAVAFSNEQMTTMRKELGLPETADEATIVAAMSEALSEQAEDTPSTTPASAIPAGMALIEKDVLAGLLEQGRQGSEARKQQLTEARDRTIAKAIADGKITPARKEHWENAWDADSDGAQETLAKLEPGLVPVSERGHDQASTSGASSAYDALYGHLQQKGA